MSDQSNTIFVRQSVKIRAQKRQIEELLAERAALLARIDELKGEPVAPAYVVAEITGNGLRWVGEIPPVGTQLVGVKP